MDTWRLAIPRREVRATVTNGMDLVLFRRIIGEIGPDVGMGATPRDGQFDERIQLLAELHEDGMKPPLAVDNPVKVQADEATAGEGKEPQRQGIYQRPVLLLPRVTVPNPGRLSPETHKPRARFIVRAKNRRIRGPARPARLHDRIALVFSSATAIPLHRHLARVRKRPLGKRPDLPQRIRQRRGGFIKPPSRH